MWTETNGTPIRRLVVYNLLDRHPALVRFLIGGIILDYMTFKFGMTDGEVRPNPPRVLRLITEGKDE